MECVTQYVCALFALPRRGSTRTAGSPSAAAPSRYLRLNLLVTDLGFLVYWLISALSLLPSDWLYKDASNPILMAWNWSFAPVDLAASAAGLTALRLAQANMPAWRPVAVLSAALTFCAGLMAISFWALRQDFAFSRWLPNIYLVLWPLGVLNELSETGSRR